MLFLFYGGLYMSKIGERIYTARKAKEWTQEELAHKMGYKSKSTINKIEIGINDIPQSKIAKFADILGVTIPYLMGWTNDPSPSFHLGAASGSITFSPDEEQIILAYRNADEITKGMVRRCLGLDEEEVVPGRKAALKVAEEFLGAPAKKLKY
jgi:transcriptional regulator with XRE-family HTH domain